ncbi:MAG: hypothetical protein AAFV59_12790 [Pseudomonadota bacterium]
MRRVMLAAANVWDKVPDPAKRVFPIIAIACMLAPKVLSSGWTGNEIFYYGIADRWMQPDLYPETHAIFDDSIARIVSYVVIGSFTTLLGFEYAEIWLSALMLMAYVVAYWRLAKALDLDLLGALICLGLFLVIKQTLLSGSYIFGGVEPKTFAYACALIGVACAIRSRIYLAVFWLAAATYFHFLIGAFWGGMILWLFLIQTRDISRVLRPAIVFTVLCLPLAIAIAFERLTGASVDSSGLDRTLEQIYAEFRHPHHLVPFLSTQSFLTKWLPGVLTHAGVGAAILFWAFRNRDEPKTHALAVWIATLNLYVFIALCIAFFDRSTHYLSALFVFRPTALILLLTLAWAIKTFAIPAWSSSRPRLRGTLVTFIAVVTTAQFSLAVIGSTHDREALAETQSAATTRMIEWIKSETPPDSTLLISAAPDERMSAETRKPWLGIERLMQRSTLVSFKYVPTTDAAMLRWYKLLQWREAFFAGSCEAYEDITVDYLIIAGAETVEDVEDCSVTVWNEGDYFVQKVTDLKSQ